MSQFSQYTSNLINLKSGFSFNHYSLINLQPALSYRGFSSVVCFKRFFNPIYRLTKLGDKLQIVKFIQEFSS